MSETLSDTVHAGMGAGMGAGVGDGLELEDAARDDGLPFVTAFARGLTIIQAFGPDRPDSTLAELAKVTNLPRATVRRCLHTLVSLGFARNHGRYFALTPKIMSLGFSYLSTTPLPGIAQPYLEELSEKTGEPSSLSVLEGSEILYVARAATSRISSGAPLMVGSRLPAFCTAMGRVLLSGLGEDELARWLRQATIHAFTDRTVTDLDRLTSTVRNVVRDGYALVDREYESSLRSIAVPLYGPDGSIIASMNVSAPAERMGLEQMSGAVLEALRHGADGLTAALYSSQTGRLAAG